MTDQFLIILKLKHLIGTNITDPQNFQFGLFCLTNHHSNNYKQLQNSPFFWDTLYIEYSNVM